MAVGGERHVDVGTARVGVDHGGSGDDARRGAGGTATKADVAQRLQYLERGMEIVDVDTPTGVGLACLIPSVG